MMRSVIISALVSATLAAGALADSITLRDGDIEPAARVVTLADVADLDGDWAQAWADLVVAPMPTERLELTVQMDDVRRTLDGQKVHWGKLSLRGRRSLTVTRRAAAAEPVEPVTPQPQPQAEATPTTVTANPVGEIDITAPAATTLRDHVRQLIERTHAVGGDDLRITYLQDDSPAWSLTDAGCRFELEPMDRDLLGRVPIVARRWQGETLLGSERVSVDVSIRRVVVTANHALQRNQTITAEDVTVESRWMADGRVRSFDSVEPIVGQVAAHSIRGGQAIGADDVRPELLVRRGQQVTVRAISGGLVVKTVARAQEDGGLGELIEVEVRNSDKTRERFHAKITGNRQAVMLVGSNSSENQGGQP